MPALNLALVTKTTHPHYYAGMVGGEEQAPHPRVITPANLAALGSLSGAYDIGGSDSSITQLTKD